MSAERVLLCRPLGLGGSCVSTSGGLRTPAEICRPLGWTCLLSRTPGRHKVGCTWPPLTLCQWSPDWQAGNERFGWRFGWQMASQSRIQGLTPAQAPPGSVSVYAAISKVTIRTATSVMVTIFRSRSCLRGVFQCGSSVGAIESSQRNCIGPPGLVEQTQLLPGSYDARQRLCRASGTNPTDANWSACKRFGIPTRNACVDRVAARQL